ncbi:MAG: sulfatase-like hydrolase/transferase [Lachnospiraceae bacterium]|nr:sulfatase-like hydrolase/transferase [Lachnospiraceae bacterium]
MRNGKTENKRSKEVVRNTKDAKPVRRRSFGEQSKRKRERQFWNKISVWVGIFLFPAIFLYYEILFKLFGGIAPGNAVALLFFVLAAGGLAQVIYLLLPGRTLRYRYTLIVLFITAVLFITECFVGRAFQTFMTFESLLTGAGDAAGDFGSTIVRTVIYGWYVILIYLIPVLLVWLLGERVIFKRKPLCRASLLVLAVSVLCFLGGNLAAIFSPVYRDGYQFDLSVRTFGLFTTLRLETANALMGGQNEDEFVAVEPGADDKDGQSGDGKQSGDDGKAGQNGESDAQGKSTEDSTDEAAQSAAQPEAKYGLNEMKIDFAALAASEKESVLKNLDLYLDSQKGTSQNEYTGLFKGKNLIMICAEAFSPYAVSEELTPTLYRLLHNGFYFSDYYQPAWGGSTSTGEYSMLTGLIPTAGVKSIRKTEGHNLYLSMGNQLSRLKYHSFAYHNNSHTYYGRNKTHKNFGYDVFMGMGNGMEKGVKNCWPQSDKEMMDFTVSQYIDKQPFSVYYMTVSGHCGYSLTSNSMSKKNWDAVQGVDASDTIKAYIASQLELEYGMKSLISQLEKAGILNDTVICMTSDHYPYGLEKGDTWGNDRNYLPELYGCSADEFNKFVQDRNGLVLWSGCLENDQKHMVKEISEPVYSLDILPTLSNLFGVEYDSRLLVGRDVFSDAVPLVIWPDYSWKTDQVTYNAATGSITEAEGADVSDEYIKKIKQMVKNRFNLSKATLNYDYWDKVFR